MWLYLIRMSELFFFANFKVQWYSTKLKFIYSKKAIKVWRNKKTNIGIFFSNVWTVKFQLSFYLPSWKKLTCLIVLRICKFLTEIWCQKPNLLSEIQIGVLSFLPVLHAYFSLSVSSLLELDLAGLNVNSYCDISLLIWIWFCMFFSSLCLRIIH